MIVHFSINNIVLAFGELKIEAKEDTSIGESKKDDDTNKRDHDETDE